MTRRHVIHPLSRLARRWPARSWFLAKAYYRLHGFRLEGSPGDEVWYFAFGANMHDSAFRERRGMQPLEWRPGRIKGYRLRFNLEGRPIGRAAPANISPALDAEVWGVLYKITRRAAVWLDASEGVPGLTARCGWRPRTFTATASRPPLPTLRRGKRTDGSPSLR